MKYIINVLCPDKSGIVYKISQTVFNNGGNISDVSQTVFKGYFTGIFYVEFEETPDMKKLNDEFSKTENAKINIVPYYESEVSFPVKEKYVLTVRCREQKGIVAKICKYLYGNNINIESFSAFTENDEFVLVSEISVREDSYVTKIKEDIKNIGKEWNISVHLSHENIYLATNTVCPTVRIGKS